MFFFKTFILALVFPVSLSYGKKYPPVPENKNKLPAPIQKEITNITNLCKLSTIEEQARSLQKSVENLKTALPHYISIGSHDYNVKHGLRAMSLAFHNDEFMLEYWNKLFNDSILAGRIVREYLNNRARNYNLSDIARDPKTAINCFSYNWEHDIYRGFYCMAYGEPPPKYKRKLGHNC